MKNLKNIAATLVLVMVMGVSYSFGGIFITDRSVNNNDCPTKDVAIYNTGIMVAGFNSSLEGIMVAGIEGIMVAGKTINNPCSQPATEGIMVAG